MTLETFLKQRGVSYEKHDHPSAFTAQRLADTEHVSGYMVAKPVVVRTSAGFAMCVLPAPKQLDLDRVADVLRDPNIRLATETEMANLFPDCELGAEPPIGAMYGLRTVVDTRLLNDEYLIMQAGSHTESIRAKREDWQNAFHPEVAHIAAG